MSERCHCTHNVSKRACQHKGFCERIKEVFVIGMLEAELATVRKDRHRSAVAMQKRIEKLEAELRNAEGYLQVLNDERDDAEVTTRLN